jgi:uncharacterized protein YggU (UPF0235/DUF167 family)
MKRRLVRVHVHAGARRESLVDGGGKLELSVKEKAERNAANERARVLLAHHFGVPAKAVRLVSGHHRAQKTFEVVY